ncbi:unnamed protein product [Boreogadus saida]
MTATSAGGSTCLTTKGLDISLAALRRQDPYINNIVDVASQVALYTFNNRTNEWEKTEVEGTLFVYTRLASPRHGFTIMNRLSMENLTEPITKELDFQLQDPFLLYRNARFVIHGIWFYDKQDCQRIAQRMKTLTQQEQALAQSQSQGGGPLPPGGGVAAGGGGGGGGGGAEVGGGVEGHPVDILQMLAKARNEYDKGGQSSTEPKEIGGSSMLFGNPHLIKPIPVKPITQDGDPGEPRSLSLATLFGSQPAHPSPSATTGPLSPRPPPTGSAPSLAAAPSSGSSKKPGGRPAVARSLSYDDPVGAPRAARGPAAAAPPSALPLMKAPMMGDSGAPHGESPNAAVRGPVASGPPGSPYSAYVVTGPHQPHQPPQPQQPPQQGQGQLCPAIQKLIQGPLGQGGPPPPPPPAGPASLHTVSESPENRLCENGLTLLEQQQQQHHQHQLHHQHLQHQQHLQQHQQHLHQHHHLHQQHQHHHQQPHQHQPQYQQSPQQDHIQRLFQAQAQAQAQALVQAQALAQAQAQAQALVPVSTAPCCSNPPPPLIPSMQHPMQPITAESVSYNPHLQHSQHVYFSPCKPLPVTAATPSGQQAPGVSSTLPGVAPHELLQKLQLVHQEHGHPPHEAPRHGPGFAPRFQGPAPTQDPGSALGPGEKEAMRFPVASPQRIPATVAPTLLLSPSVFSQAKAAGPPQDGGSAAGPPAPEEAPVLSRSQLQDTLLHLIRTDSSFIDCIYKAYIGGLARDSQF